MDDVFVVIGLLLFGSLLFCLCCYKVSNLLYLLYHIDDHVPSTSSLDNHSGTNLVLSEATAGVPHTFAHSYALAAAEAAATGNMPDVNEVALDKMGDEHASLPRRFEYDERAVMLHYTNVGGGMRSTESASSLVTGPDNLMYGGATNGGAARTNSETCLLPRPGGVRLDGCQPQQQQQHRRGRLPSPSPSRLFNDLTNQRSHQRVQYHGSTPEVFAYSTGEPLYGSYHHHGQDRGYRQQQQQQHQHYHQHHYRRGGSGQESVDEYFTGSLGRRLHQPQYPHYEKQQQQQQHLRNHQGDVFAHYPSFHGSKIPSSAGAKARRYGSIRVAECSFIEQNDDRDTGNSADLNNQNVAMATEDVSPPPMCDRHRQLLAASGRRSSFVSGYHSLHQGASSLEVPRPSSAVRSKKMKPSTRSPSPTRSPFLALPTHSSSSPGKMLMMSQCNGPRSVGVANLDNTANNPNIDKGKGLSSTTTSVSAASAGSSIIIPPPQNFEDLQQRNSSSSLPHHQQRW